MRLNDNVIPFAYSRRNSGLNGLSPLIPLVATALGQPEIGAAAAAMGSGTSTGDAGAGMGLPGQFGQPQPITVSPTIQTAISPQISPVFQQSYMPSGSPMTAGTTQTAPTSQTAPQAGLPGMPGMLPGGTPLDTSGFPSPINPAGAAYSLPGQGGVFQSQAPSFMRQYGMWIAGGAAGLLLLAVLMKKKRT